MRISIFCCGSATEGLGHLYRAGAFAAEACKSHQVRIVARADARYRSILSDLPCPAHFVADDAEFVAHAGAVPTDITVFDVLSIRDDHFAAIRALSGATASICPVISVADRIDLLFTRGTRPPEAGRARIFAGLDYTIMNRFCRPIPQSRFAVAAADPLLPVMVSFGGADGENHTRRMLTVLRQAETPLLVWALLGDGYRHSHDDLVSAFGLSGRHELVIARSNRSMWRIASNCAVAILSSGLSTVEAMFAGLPVISVERSGDPSNLVGAAYEAQCLEGGRFIDGSYGRVRSLIETLARDRSRLFEQRRRQIGISPDSRGAQRVLAEIESFVRETRMTGTVA